MLCRVALQRGVRLDLGGPAHLPARDYLDQNVVDLGLQKEAEHQAGRDLNWEYSLARQLEDAVHYLQVDSGYD